MPIEIRELHIRVQVPETSEAAASTDGVPSVSDFSITKQSDHETPFYLKLQGVDGDVDASLPQQRQATLNMFTASYAGGDAEGFGDGSVRGIRNSTPGATLGLLANRSDGQVIPNLD